jgi:uncharacterized protein YkwD
MGRTSSALGMPPRTLTALAGLVLACSSAAPRQAPAAAVARTQDTPRVAADTAELFTFPELTESPLPVRDVPSALAPFFAECARGDAALSRVAERFARRQSQGEPPLDVSEISFALRAEGSPYVWPRAWTLEGGDLTGPAAVERLRGWLASFGDGGERRCGIALVSAHGRNVLAAVAADALADLDAVPVRASSGSWLNVSGRLLVPASEAKLIVLGPSGAPFGVPTSFDGQRVQARFHADRPGAFLVQLLANVSGGPRPLLEATTYVDVRPPSSFFGDAAPGEPAEPLSAPSDAADALLSMVNVARQSEQTPPLLRHAALDAVADKHAQAMRRLGRIAHDVGDGDPRTRVESANLDILTTGENVAHALNVVRAHRALWASPSHRENLLEPRYDGIGIGVAPDPDGSLWVCEVFADFRDRPGPPR